MIFAHLRHFYVLFHDPLANNARKFKSVLNLYLEIILTTTKIPVLTLLLNPTHRLVIFVIISFTDEYTYLFI